MSDVQTDPPIRVLIADDHPTFLAGLTALLSVQADLEVVGEAHSCSEVLDLSRRLAPEVLVLDLQMPPGSGLDAIPGVLKSSPETKVLVLTMFEDGQSVLAAVRAGAQGYVHKGAGRHELLRAVRAVAAGDAIFSPAVAGHLLANLRIAGTDQEPFPQLSGREREVLALLADGLDNAEIARRLFLSAKTVRNHVSSIFTKLQVNGRAEAIVRARRAGLGNV